MPQSAYAAVLTNHALCCTAPLQRRPRWRHHVTPCLGGLQVLSTFRSAAEQLAAAVALFARLREPADLTHLLLALAPPQRRRLHQRLGLLAFFDAANPTGRCAVASLAGPASTVSVDSTGTYCPALCCCGPASV